MLIWLILYLPYVGYCLPFQKDFAGRGAQNTKAMHIFLLSIFLHIEKSYTNI